jgi:hypothetical protein
VYEFHFHCLEMIGGNVAIIACVIAAAIVVAIMVIG